MIMLEVELLMSLMKCKDDMTVDDRPTILDQVCHHTLAHGNDEVQMSLNECLTDI
jgi:hypothetical protein